MKLKRYVLLDNNHIITSDNNDLWQDYPGEWSYTDNGEGSYGEYHKVVNTSDSVFGLVDFGDLIEYQNGDYKEVFQITKPDNGEGEMELNYETLLNIPEGYGYIVAIYKKQIKNYICVWEKEVC